MAGNTLISNFKSLTMKQFNILYRSVLFIAFAAMLVATGFNVTKPTKALTAAYVKKLLTNNQWTLAEIVQAKGDSSVNLTLFMLPCEKDNLLHYQANGTYQILEGEKKCTNSTEKVKGSGTWEFEDSEQVIIDSYMGGRRIEKKIIELNPDMYKVQYESEGRTITTLTYFSETGLKNEALTNDVIVDNSDHSKNIAASPREALVQAHRYVVVGRRDFEKGQMLNLDDKKGLLKKVIVYPFMNSTDPNMTVQENERNIALINQGKKVGIDYIITGNIIKATSDVDKNNRYMGHVKYAVSILDIKSGEEKIRKTFEYSQREAEVKAAKSEQQMRTVIGVMGAASVMRSSYYYGYYGRYQYGWNSYYNYYFVANTANVAAYGLSSAFADGMAAERNHYYQSSLAVMDAIAHTTEDVAEFVIQNLPLTIKINDVARSAKGKIENLTIEAGSNVNLQEKETLQAVKIETITMSDGTVTEKATPIAKLKVKTVNTRLSVVEPSMYDIKKLEKALEESPDKIFVWTTEIPKSSK